MRAFSVQLSAFSLLVVLAAASCAPTRHIVTDDGQKVPYEKAARDTLAPALEAFEAGRYDEAAALLETWLASFADAKRADEARYYLARALTALGRPADANTHWLAILERHPLSPYVTEAQIEVASAYLETGAYNDAAQLLAPVVPELTGEVRLRAAQLLAAAYEGLAQWPAAVAWYSEVRALSPDASVQAQVDARLVDIVDARLSGIELETLRQDLDRDSPLYPLVIVKLARLHYHLRDYAQAHATLAEYLEGWPEGQFAEGARLLLEQLDRLARVRPGVVGILLPQSGKYEAFGKAVMDGIGMALQTEAGADAPVTLVIKDTAGDPATAVKAFEALVLEEQAIAVIGPLLQNTASAVAAKAEELGVPLVSLARVDGLADLGPWVFQNALTDAMQVRGVVDYAVDVLQAKSIGLMYPNHAYGLRMMEHFWTAVEARQLEVRAAERYDHDETTFSAAVKKMVGRYYLSYREEHEKEKERCEREVTDSYRQRKCLEKARDELEPIVDFDVLFVPDSYKTVTLIAPALAVEDVITNVCDTRDLERIRKTTGKDELPTTRLMGVNAWNHPDLPARGGKFVRCSVFVDAFFAQSARKETQAFVQAYQTAYGKDATPPYLAALGHDTAAIVREVVLGQAPPDRSAFRDALLSVRDFPGATGATSFRANGEVEKPLFFLTVDRDAIVELGSEGGASN